MKYLLTSVLILKTLLSFSQDTAFFQNVEWSPAGEKICAEVIHRAAPAITYEGYIIDVKTKTIERKIPGAVFPAWSPDGKFVAYSKRNASAHGLDIWMMNVATGDTIRLTNDTTRNSGISFSPDGKQICFSSDRAGGRNLFIMDTDGSHIERITFDTLKYFNPVWSPKGNSIVYYREKGDQRDKIFVLDVSTKKETIVTADSLHDIYPGWLPGGKTISYTFSDPSIQDDKNQIAIIGVNGNNKHVLNNSLQSFFARVSPDGKKIAVISGAWPISNIYIENMNGNNITCVTCELHGR